MTRTAPTPTRSTGTIRAVQAGAALSVVVLLFQFVTAGQVLADSSGARDGHGAGAIALHVVGLLLVVATLRHARAGGARWPVVVSAAVFVAGFVQAALGDSGNMAAHVPGSLVLSIGTVWVTAWAFTRQPVA
ncbi:hypothetical protein GCU67_10680 [Modestobacter muralis]|uniref:Uncharacterized protein n=1 Tax=Modestobacter muralis TaxID=1608614 RepID=A0A6P0H8V2_9ACTN|nr:hypothetical protein [Modestobacter muralis]NEK94631.1 hypothetical protein [Modestobacter muralis]NEN51519.1 hypothetical protein [Modestobacter muralis]